MAERIPDFRSGGTWRPAIASKVPLWHSAPESAVPLEEAMYFEIYERERSVVAALRGHLMGGGDWRWTLKNARDEIVASGQGFPTRSECEKAVAKLKQDIAVAPLRSV